MTVELTPDQPCPDRPLVGADTAVLITVDTELSALLHQRGVSASENVARSITGRCAAGDFGVGWQIDRLNEHGLRGVFFVDPLPALVLGEGVVADLVGPILDAGHEIQLHAHPEWLAWARASPVDGRQGRNIGDFSLSDQIVLLKLGCDLLVGAGAPRPVAFRAGNFGASDTTLDALAAVGLEWDSSLNADYVGRGCAIGMDRRRNLPKRHRGVVEVPVSGLYDRGDHFRPAQVCALSTWEMSAALNHAAAAHHPVFTIVTHSFEMLSRDRLRPNRAVMARFVAVARAIADRPGLVGATFADLDACRLPDADAPRLAPARLRTWCRVAAQAIATWRYEHRLRPA